MARQLVNDVNENGEVGYPDVLQWIRLKDSAALRADYGELSRRRILLASLAARTGPIAPAAGYC